MLPAPGVAFTPQLTWKEPPHEPEAARVLPLSLGQTASVGLGVELVVVLLVEVERVVG